MERGGELGFSEIVYGLVTASVPNRNPPSKSFLCCNNDPPSQFPSIPEDETRVLALNVPWRVCKFQRWVDPIVYRTQTLRMVTEGCKNFLRTLETAKSPSFFSAHLKAITF